MNEFVKPTRVEIDISNEIKNLFGTKLTKDLHDNEAICPVCKGTGIRIEQNRYGLSDDSDKQLGHFPYLHQSFSFCQNCYNGIVRYCPDCGRQLSRGSLKCTCEAEKHRQHEAKRKKEQHELESATKYEPSALGDRFMMCYSRFCDSDDGYFSDWEEFFDSWYEYHEGCTPRPQYVWGTNEIEMSLDAYDIVSVACEDLYEDAIDDIGEDAIGEMQSFLDKWKEKYGRLAYAESHKCAIKIPWDQFEQKAFS